MTKATRMRMYLEIQQLGARAVNAVHAALGPDGLTPAAAMQAADWLEAGDRRAGVARKWTRLASQLRRIAHKYEAHTARETAGALNVGGGANETN